MFSGLIATPLGRGFFSGSRQCIRSVSILTRGRLEGPLGSNPYHRWQDQPSLVRPLMSVCCGRWDGGQRSVLKRFSSLPQNGPGSEMDRVEPWTKSCGCCGMHTEGDRDMANYLRDELRIEKTEAVRLGRSLPRLRGFEVTSTFGPSIMLTKKSDNETVTVKFNVNDSLEEEGLCEEGGEEDRDKMGPISSRPVFVVEVSKGGSAPALALSCSLLSPDELPLPDDLELGEDLSPLRIDHVAMLTREGTEWDESIYTPSTTRIGGKLYDMLVLLLAERGVDTEFFSQLVEFSTAYEHLSYLAFLEQLADYTSCR